MAGRPRRFESAVQYREVLYAALGEPIGLILDSGGNALAAKSRLYQERKNIGDEMLDCLQIRQWEGGEGDLVIVKVQRGKPDGTPNGTETL